MFATRARGHEPIVTAFQASINAIVIGKTYFRPPREVRAMSGSYALPALRDRFLLSLEAPANRLLSVQLALSLLGCRNPLPGMTCEALGLVGQSTYGCAARRVLELYSTNGTGMGEAGCS